MSSASVISARGVFLIGGLGAALLLAACGMLADDPPPPPPQAILRLSGSVRLEADSPRVPTAGGALSVRFYRQPLPGYCLRGADDVFAIAYAAIDSPTKRGLLDGAPIELTLREPSDRTLAYPLELYPVVTWQHTREPERACELNYAAGPADDGNISNLIGVSGEAAAPDACCGSLPPPLRIDAPGAEFSGLSFVLREQPRITTECADPSTTFDRCSLRRQPDGQETACALSLGADRDRVLTLSSGEPCP